jgi:hypothetical protein
MSGAVRAVAVTVLLCTVAAVGACGGGDDDVADAAAGVTTTTRARTLTVCGIEEAADAITADPSVAGDFAGQRENAIAFLDEMLALRATGQPAEDIAADYASVTEAYQVVRDGFAAASTPDDYLAKVEQGADEAFGGPAEVERFTTAYTAWVVENCGFDPQLGITLYASG